MADRQWVHKGDLKLVRQCYLRGHAGAPYDALEYCRAERKPLPAWAADAIIKDYREGRAGRPRKMGRHARPEERLKQLMSDGLWFLRVQRLMKDERLSQTAAEAKAACQAGQRTDASTVHKACKRMAKRYRQALRDGGRLFF